MLNQYIQSILNEGVLGNFYGGASLLVFKGGRELLYAQAGCQDKEAGSPITRDSLFRIYSMTKPVTAAAAMILVQRGQLDMAAPVSRFLPGFKNQQVMEDGKLVPAACEATVAQLLSMTSGVVYPGGADQTERLMGELFKEYEEQPMKTVDFANRMGRIPLAFHPGSSFRYGASADVLGAVIEVVSGKPLEVFLKDELFTPLEMTSTGFYVEKENATRLATCYQKDGQGGLMPFTSRHLAVGGLYENPPAFASGGAGLVSCADDYMHFGQMLLNKGVYKGTRILAPETVAFMTQPQLSPQQQRAFMSNDEGYSYGRFMEIRVEKGRGHTLGSVGEYGWGGWLGTLFFNDPVLGITFVLMTQCMDTAHETLVNRLRNALYGSL